MQNRVDNKLILKSDKYVQRNRLTLSLQELKSSKHKMGAKPSPGVMFSIWYL